MRARGGHLNWHAKHANMVTGGHKEGKNEGKPETVRMPHICCRLHVNQGPHITRALIRECIPPTPKKHKKFPHTSITFLDKARWRDIWSQWLTQQYLHENKNIRNKTHLWWSDEVNIIDHPLFADHHHRERFPQGRGSNGKIPQERKTDTSVNSFQRNICVHSTFNPNMMRACK